MHTDRDEARAMQRTHAMPHILSTSSTMLGVCMTVLSLTRSSDDPLPYWLSDKVVAFAALLFLTSCFCSFVSLRDVSHGLARSLRLEQRAEWIFMTDLLLLGVGAVILAFVVQ